MKEVFKTFTVFLYFNLMLLPFAYLIGTAVFNSHNWFNEFNLMQKDHLQVITVTIASLEFYFLFLAAKFKVEKD